MVKSKFVALATAFSMIAGLGTSFITANADSSVAVVNKGIELVYDAAASNETTKVINAYYKGADVIASAALAFEIEGVTVTDASYTTEWGGAKQFNKSEIANGKIGFSYTDTDASTPTTDKKALTLTLTVAEDVDFKVTLTNVDLMTSEFAEIKYSNSSADQSWVNVPAYNTPEPGATDVPVAEVNKGIELVYDAAASNETTKVIKAYYKGADVIASAALAFEIEGVTVTDASYTTEWGGAKQFNKSEIADGKIGFSYTDTDASAPTTDKLALTLTLTVAEDVDFKVTLTNVDLMTSEFAEIKYSNSSADEAWVYVPAYNSASGTEAPGTEAPGTEAPGTEAPGTEAPGTEAPGTEAPGTEAPGTEAPQVITRPTPIPTAKPEGGGEPATEAPVAEVNKGIELVYDEASSNETTKVIKAYYKGADVIASAALGFEIEGVTITDASYTTEWGGAKQFNKSEIADGKIGFSYTDTDASAPTTDKLALTLTLTAAEDVDFKVTLTNVDLMTSEFAEIKYSNSSADQSWVYVPAYNKPVTTQEPVTTPEPFDEDRAIPMSDTIADGYDKQTLYGTLVGLSVEATKDGDDAVYGTDYVAAYNGKELTSNEYQNLINGYTEPDITKVVDGIYFLTKDGVTFGTAPMYQTSDQVEDGVVTVLNGFAKPVKAEPEQPEADKASVVFLDENDNLIKYVEVTKGGKVKASQIPNVPSKIGYNGSWVVFGTEERFTSNTVVKEDTVVVPRYTKQSSGGGGGGGSSSSGGTGGGATMIARGDTGTATDGPAVITAQFSDLDAVPWAVSAINALAQANIVNGVNDSNTLYQPLNHVTRAQFAKMICVLFEIPQASPDASRFSDVPWYAWYIGWVEAAANAGIVQGISDTEFAPEANITREQMATMLYRAIVAKGLTLSGEATIAFTDAAFISDYAVAPINALVGAGVVQGREDGSFGPQDLANRAEAACILYQYILAGLKF